MNTSTGPSNVRKRLISIGDEPIGPTLRKRPRISSVSSISADFQIQLLGGSATVTSVPDRLPRSRPLHGDDINFLGIGLGTSHHRHARPLSGSSSFTAGSRACSPGDIGDQPGSSAFISSSGLALMRRVSSASLASSSHTAPTYPESSAKHHLRNTKLTIDFSALPAPPPALGATDPSPELLAAPLLSCSAANVVFFSRGNRVHYKNLLTISEDVGQLCKLQDSHGDLRIIECGGADQPDVVALGTSKGLVQIWDVKAKKKTASWSTKGVSAMRWNGPVLTVGGLKGTIRHYDTRVASMPKMKEQARKVTRHQSRITSLEWNVDGQILASGDQSGTVYCWDMKEKVPLDVGEFIQRRKKMQHGGAVSALAWCPWQPKLLASGDVQGAIQLWTVNASSPHSNATVPGKLELGAPITGLHFSPHCKELLSTHGASPETEVSPTPPIRSKMSISNSIAVHSYPYLRHVTTLNIADKPIGCSVLSASGTRLVLAVPEEGKINVCDVWTKRKEVKRQPSFFGSMIR